MLWVRKHLASRIGRVGAGAAALLALAVFLWPAKPWSFQPDKFAGFLVALCLWLWAELDGLGQPHPRDLQLYQRIFETVTHDERLALAEHDMGDSFHKDRFSGLGQVYDDWRGPAFEFVDPKLQALWASLKDELNEFTLALVTHTGPLPGNQMLFTVKTVQDLQTGSRSELTIRNTKTLNELARKAATGLDDFERFARSRLQA